MPDTSIRYPMLPPEDVLFTVQVLAEKSDYNHKLMNIPAMWESTRGAGVKIAVLDTGVPKHVDLRPVDGCVAAGIASGAEDRVGHALHCAGIVAALAGNGIGINGIAPDVDDYYIKALNDDGSGTVASIVDGIHKAVDVYGVDIISMSLGISARVPHYRSLENACNYAVSQGVAVFAAAGNDGAAVGQPAIYDSVIAVGAVDSRKRKARFSNFGPQVDFVAGGVNVYSTHLNNGYASLSGTSMSCPALAGAAALILSKHIASGEKLSPTELKEHISRIALDLGNKGRDEMFGDGLPVFKNSAEPVISRSPGPALNKEDEGYDRGIHAQDDNRRGKTRRKPAQGGKCAWSSAGKRIKSAYVL